MTPAPRRLGRSGASRWHATHLSSKQIPSTLTAVFGTQDGVKTE